MIDEEQWVCKAKKSGSSTGIAHVEVSLQIEHRVPPRMVGTFEPYVTTLPAYACRSRITINNVIYGSEFNTGWQQINLCQISADHGASNLLPERTAALDGAKYGSLLSEFAACCIWMGQDLLSCTFTCLQGSLHAGVDGKVCCLAGKEEHTAHRRCQSIPVHKHTLLQLVSVLEILLKASAFVWPSTEAPVYLPIRVKTFKMKLQACCTTNAHVGMLLYREACTTA